MMFIFINFLLLLHIVQSALLTPSQTLKYNETIIDLNQKPEYVIGIIFPNATDPKIANNTDLTNMILTSELSIKLAADQIRDNNILPGTMELYINMSINEPCYSQRIYVDVDLKFIRYYADETLSGDVIFNAVNMIENGVE